MNVEIADGRYEPTYLFHLSITEALGMSILSCGKMELIKIR